MSNGTVQQLKSVDSKCFPLKTLFSEKFTVDFYQREYVWEKKQLEDLINDLSNAFLKCWDSGHTLENVRTYDPYFMGEIGGDLGGLLLSMLAALVPTALLIAETFMLSSTQFESFACDEVVAKIDRLG